MSESRQDQIEENYREFQKALPDLMRTHAGKFALMGDGKIEAFFDTARDAVVAGEKLHPDGVFSIQEVTKTPVDLGFFSHALP